VYVLSRDGQIQILHLLVEGNSIRSIERLTGSHRDTIMRLLVAFGQKCRTFLDGRLRGLRLQHLEIDEIWTFVKRKQATIIFGEDDSKIGDQYVFTAIDQKTKLIACYALGKRTSEVARAFMLDLASRIVTAMPQISSDGWPGFKSAVESAFGWEVNYGQLIKTFGEGVQEGRYGPPDVVAIERKLVNAEDGLDPFSICTSHVERNNLTIRTFMKRFTRLSMGFSKKLENLAAAVALHVAHYNFCRVHGSLDKITPAMAAGVIGELWTIEDLYDSVMK
jgi:IS1 family transposase